MRVQPAGAGAGAGQVYVQVQLKVVVPLLVVAVRASGDVGVSSLKVQYLSAHCLR